MDKIWIPPRASGDGSPAGTFTTLETDFHLLVSRTEIVHCGNSVLLNSWSHGNLMLQQHGTNTLAKPLTLFTLSEQKRPSCSPCLSRTHCCVLGAKWASGHTVCSDTQIAFHRLKSLACPKYVLKIKWILFWGQQNEEDG